ncbi:MAG: DoxX family protein [Candidatus Woesearchaeota archaeon]|nr:DoxX family protein [Candidatus Woesearchaeota archaeon]
MKYTLLLLVLLVPSALAHVGYVVEKDVIAANTGPDFMYLLNALTPGNAALILITLILVGVIYYMIEHSRFALKELGYIQKEANTYHEYIPWISRLGLGIALIGAGSADVFLSPSVAAIGHLGTLQIVLGFFLLAGFLTGPVAWITVFLYCFGVFSHPYLLGNLDFVGLCFAIIILGESKPGVDDLVGLPFTVPLHKLKAYVPLILRCGIGIAMTSLALYEKLLNPHLSRLVVEQYNLTSAIPVSAEMWVLSAGLIEFAVGLALLLGFRTRVFAAIAFIVLSASFFYFSEAVYSHITLFATLSAVFITGGGAWSLDRLFKWEKA